jgi:uncharacterized membrane protein
MTAPNQNAAGAAAGSGYMLTTGRLEALSDGVLAIVITLLVLDFFDLDKGIAAVSRDDPQRLLQTLIDLWPHVLGYALSFMLIAIYWMMHHVMFHYIRHADRGLLWLNMAFLMCVAFLPFPTDLLAECMRYESTLVVALYGVTHCVTGLSLLALWWYAAHAHRLVSPEIDRRTVREVTLTAITSPALYAMGVVLSLVSIPAGIAVYAAIPLLYVIPAHLERRWLSLPVRAAKHLAMPR